ncbi:MAG: hypothetical protein H3C54_06675 [Taibaiella sp.]|nr:hypothetical protein [Taibaiella sp.]
MENWKLKKLIELDTKYPGALDDFIEEMERHEKTITCTETEIQKLRRSYEILVKYLPGLEKEHPFEALIYGDDSNKPKRRKKWRYRG